MVEMGPKEHFMRIAEAERELEKRSIDSAARRSVAQNIADGFALSAFATAFGGVVEQQPKVALITLRRQHASSHGK